MEKNKNDIRILRALIHEQNMRGAQIPRNLDSWRCRWDKETGRLMELNLNGYGLRGYFSVSGLPGLVRFCCSYNALTGLDVSGCPALKELFCMGNRIRELDVSNNPMLEYLGCTFNRLKSLDFSHNPAMKDLNCDISVSVSPPGCMEMEDASKETEEEQL